MFNRKTKELQSLVDSSRRSLKGAESRIKNKSMLIADLQNKNNELTKENIEVHEENKELRFENEEIKDIIKEIDNLSKTQQYGSVENLQNKIKSILMTAKSI